jgi:hypothetical protein
MLYVIVDQPLAISADGTRRTPELDAYYYEADEPEDEEDKGADDDNGR